MFRTLRRYHIHSAQRRPPRPPWRGTSYVPTFKTLLSAPRTTLHTPPGVGIAPRAIPHHRYLAAPLSDGRRAITAACITFLLLTRGCAVTGFLAHCHHSSHTSCRTGAPLRRAACAALPGRWRDIYLQRGAFAAASLTIPLRRICSLCISELSADGISYGSTAPTPARPCVARLRLKRLPISGAAARSTGICYLSPFSYFHNGKTAALVAAAGMTRRRDASRCDIRRRR